MENLLLLAQADGGSGYGPAQMIFGLVYVGVCLALIGIILTRNPKNDGLGGMMGGGDSGNFRGAKSTEDTVDSIANYVALAFIGMSIALNYVF